MSVPYAGGYLGLGNSFTSQNRALPFVGGWVELGRTTLGSANVNLDISSLADKRYLKVLVSNAGQSSNSDVSYQMNADTGSNYASRVSLDGAADITQTSNAQGFWNITNTASTNPEFSVHYIANLAGKEKLNIGHLCRQMTAGAGTAPQRDETVSKWVDTTNPLDQITLDLSSTFTFNTGSELVVLGWDPADIHTTNFWEELYSVDNTGTVASKTSDTFTAKKYLWVQMIANNVGVANNMGFQFNSDTGTNYSVRGSADGAADITGTNSTSIQNTLGAATNSFVNAFIINNSANEKLWLGNSVGQNTAGAGTAPIRWEHVGKWDNTASQITSMTVLPNTGNIDILAWRIWGSD